MADEAIPDVVRFKSGVNYNYVAVDRGDVWQTTGTDSDQRNEPLSEFGWNAINKAEPWTELIARGNSFTLATGWSPAPAVVRGDLAVVRFLLDKPQEWHAGIFVGFGSWYTTVDNDSRRDARAGGGLRIYDYPRIDGWGDIVDNSSRVELATSWQPLVGGLPTPPAAKPLLDQLQDALQHRLKESQ